MCFRKKAQEKATLKNKLEDYKKRIQEYNQKQWEDEPIEIEELIHSNYEDSSTSDGNSSNGKLTKKEIVFIDIDYCLDWITSYTVKTEVMNLINDLMVMVSLPYKHFPKDKQLSFLRIIGQGIVAALSENKDDVKNCIAQASSFHRMISLDIYKKFCLEVSTVLFLIGIITYNLIMYFGHLQCNLCSAGLWGFIGAYLSICYKTGKKEASLSFNNMYMFWNIVIRFVIGTIFGCIVYYFTGSAFFKLDSTSATSENISLLALVAGFSEKLIPNLIGKYENKFSKGE